MTMSRAVRAETRSRAKEDIKRVICAIDKVRKWEKKWVSIGEATMKIYKWVPVANQESRTLCSSRKTLFPRRDNHSMAKKTTTPSIRALPMSVPSIQHPPNEDSNLSQDSSNQDSQDNQSKPTEDYPCELNAEVADSHLTTSSQSEEEHRSRNNKNINWHLHEAAENHIYVDESTRASQGSNYGEEEEEEEVAMPTQDEEKRDISFGHQLVSNGTIIADPADGDSNIRLAMSIVGGDENEEAAKPSSPS